MKRRARKPLPRWATPSVSIDKLSLRDFYEHELFAADVDSAFVTPDDQIHQQGLTSGEITTIANLARVLEALQRRPS